MSDYWMHYAATQLLAYIEKTLLVGVGAIGVFVDLRPPPCVRALLG